MKYYKIAKTGEIIGNESDIEEFDGVETVDGFAVDYNEPCWGVKVSQTGITVKKRKVLNGLPTYTTFKLKENALNSAEKHNSK